LIDFEQVAEQVKNDLELRKLIEASIKIGVSPRRLLGSWQPALITAYFRDETGQVVRTETHYDSPEFDDLDRAYILALDLYEVSLCDGCGHPLEETTKPENSEAYVAKAPVRCHRCTAMIQAQEAYEDRPQVEALRWPIDFDPARVLDLEKWAVGGDMITDHETHLRTK
jgi:hypothetical protein